MIQIVYFCNMFLFLFLVFFRSDVSSMFASAEEVQYFSYIILFTSCMLASPLRAVTIKFPKFYTAMTKQKIPFLTFKYPNPHAKEKFVFREQMLLSIKRILASVTIVSRSEVTLRLDLSGFLYLLLHFAFKQSKTRCECGAER